MILQANADYGDGFEIDISDVNNDVKLEVKKDRYEYFEYSA